MRVVHVNTYDLSGGAARSAYRLHHGLKELGCDSWMFVRQAQADKPNVIEMRPSQKLFDRMGRRVRRNRIARDYERYRLTRPKGYEPFQDCRSPFRFDFLRELPACDVLNLHWVANSFLDYESFCINAPHSTPIVWTLHDMNAFTGGCHYDLGCDRYADSCGQCPQLGSYEPDDLSFRIWQRKAKAFSLLDSTRLRFVAPSRWLGEQARRSPLIGRFRVSIIPYGLDVDVFAPRDRVACREILGLPVEAKVVLFVADGLDNERKGFRILARALAAMPREMPVTILSVGRNKPEGELRLPWIHVGSVNTDWGLSVLYNAADIFVIPSLQDNLPNTVLEAMACGTPVLGFDVGGIPDLVRPGITGMLAPPANVEMLRIMLIRMLENLKNLRQLGLNCRRIAVEEYPSNVQASRYASLYRELLDAKIKPTVIPLTT